MYTIGQFSKIGRVSTKTLRYYDEIDLLKPTHVDQESQYRYYSEDQVLKILLIFELKEYGLRLEEIKAVMDRQDVEVLREFLKNKMREIDREVQVKQELKKCIEQKLAKIESGGSLMEVNKNLKVELKDREALTVVSRRATIAMSNVGNIIGKVFEDIYQAGMQPAGPVMTVYYDKEFDGENADLEVCVPVNKKVNPEKSDRIKELAGGLHACATFVGPYSRLGEAYAKVMKWMEENGYKNMGAPFDIYLTGPEAAKDADQFVTEVCFPVAKA